MDFGDGNEGGTLIDLVLKMNPDYNISVAIREISTVSGSSFFFHQPNISFMDSSEKEPSEITIIKTKPQGNNHILFPQPFQDLEE